MLNYDNQYKNILNEIYSEGIDSLDRTGTGTRKIFDANIKVNLSRQDDRLTFTPITMRKVYPRTPYFELIWMLRGSTDANELKEKNISIWDANTTRDFLDSRGLLDVPTGQIGFGYGKLFRDFDGTGSTDQLLNTILSIKTNPESRRHFISLWNPAKIHLASLPPCHISYNFMVTGDKLNLKFFQRSSDFILAGNVNFLFATMFLGFMAQWTGYKVGSVSHSITDCHIYNNLLSAAEYVLERDPIDHVATYQLPKMKHSFDSVDDIEQNLDDELDYLFENESWEYVKSTIDYQSHEPLPKELLVISQ